MRSAAQLKAFDGEQYVLNLFFHLCNFQVAIKSIRKEKIKDEQDMVHIRREIEIMSSLRHPHIISIYEGEGLAHTRSHARARQRHACRSHFAKSRPTLNLLGTRGPAPELSCYDMWMS